MSIPNEDQIFGSRLQRSRGGQDSSPHAAPTATMFRASQGRPETTSARHGRMAGSCCPMSDVAIVSAALMGQEATAFEEVIDGPEGAFVDAMGSREKRLGALLALRTRAAATRRDSLDHRLVPEWAHSRLPISAGRISADLVDLPEGARAAVDGVLGSGRSPQGSGFGKWAPPALLFALPTGSDD